MRSTLLPLHHACHWRGGHRAAHAAFVHARVRGGLLGVESDGSGLTFDAPQDLHVGTRPLASAVATVRAVGLVCCVRTAICAPRRLGIGALPVRANALLGVRAGRGAGGAGVFALRLRHWHVGQARVARLRPHPSRRRHGAAAAASQSAAARAAAAALPLPAAAAGVPAHGDHRDRDGTQPGPGHRRHLPFALPQQPARRAAGAPSLHPCLHQGRHAHPRPAASAPVGAAAVGAAVPVLARAALHLHALPPLLFRGAAATRRSLWCRRRRRALLRSPRLAGSGATRRVLRPIAPRSPSTPGCRLAPPASRASPVPLPCLPRKPSSLSPNRRRRRAQAASLGCTRR